MKRFVFLVLLLQCACVRSERRFPTGIDRGVSPASGARADGAVSSWGFIVKPDSENWPRRDSISSLSSKSSTACEETYGFMPCTESAVGNLFLMAVYGYLMFVAASLLSDGSELLLAVMGPGIIGGLFLPVLGAFPDALLILVTCALAPVPQEPTAQWRHGVLNFGMVWAGFVLNYYISAKSQLHF